ncbi:glycosyltransferase [Rivularia sp. PCC 7116]|uniref:glycosyltransferase family 1 protein n=1 Tax=Rivularia sp. PCC 7116 TaxID=373994 RepID=UPI00029F1D9D|nr:glycosyltransferase family 1 protein [Rivularia sp. PCC 7116]AFY54696.1 glycosyltransferase [Rivularia sp. PCC 7116]
MISTKKQPIRILHVLAGMNRGGVETWLMHVLRNIDRERFQMDFLVATTQLCAYDEEVIALGSKIIPCLHPSKPLMYARNFKRLYQQHGSYDIVHSHIHHYSGYILRLAKQVGIPIRIAHSHNDTSSQEAKAGLFRRFYLGLTEYLIKQYATLGLACSEKAASDLYGGDWKHDSRWKVLHYGIDLSAWNDTVDKANIRAELKIPKDAFVIGHVGRFAEQKNHSMFVEIASNIIQKEPKAHFLLVGDGRLRSDIEQKVHQAGLSNCVTFAGLRSDIPQVMKGAMDVFLFPSLHEGLPMVLIEAQAAGLPCVISDVISEEVDAIQSLIQRIPLTKEVSYWGKNVLNKNIPLNIGQSEALGIIKNSSFNIQKSINTLEAIYTSKVI